MLFHCKLEYPPTINHYYQTNKHNNKKFINAKAREYMQRNSQHITQKMYSLGLNKIEFKLDLYLYVYPPDARQRDKDNIQKCIFDTIQSSGLIHNDSQFKNVFVHDGEIKRGSACVIVALLPHTPSPLPDELCNYYFN